MNAIIGFVVVSGAALALAFDAPVAAIVILIAGAAVLLWCSVRNGERPSDPSDPSDPS